MTSKPPLCSLVICGKSLHHRAGCAMLRRRPVEWGWFCASEIQRVSTKERMVDSKNEASLGRKRSSSLPASTNQEKGTQRVTDCSAVSPASYLSSSREGKVLILLLRALWLTKEILPSPHKKQTKQSKTNNKNGSFLFLWFYFLFDIWTLVDSNPVSSYLLHWGYPGPRHLYLWMTLLPNPFFKMIDSGGWYLPRLRIMSGNNTATLLKIKLKRYPGIH